MVQTSIVNTQKLEFVWNKKFGKEFCSYSDELTAHFLLNFPHKISGLVSTVSSKTVRLAISCNNLQINFPNTISVDNRHICWDAPSWNVSPIWSDHQISFHIPYTWNCYSTIFLGTEPELNILVLRPIMKFIPSSIDGSDFHRSEPKNSFDPMGHRYHLVLFYIHLAFYSISLVP